MAIAKLYQPQEKIFAAMRVSLNHNRLEVLEEKGSIQH